MSSKRGLSVLVGMPLHEDAGGELLFGKPSIAILHRDASFQGFGALCPAYRSVRWASRGDRVVFSPPDGHSREWNLDAVTFKPWTRIV